MDGKELSPQALSKCPNCTSEIRIERDPNVCECGYDFRTGVVDQKVKREFKRFSRLVFWISLAMFSILWTVLFGSSPAAFGPKSLYTIPLAIVFSIIVEATARTLKRKYSLISRDQLLLRLSEAGQVSDESSSKAGQESQTRDVGGESPREKKQEVQKSAGPTARSGSMEHYAARLREFLAEKSEQERNLKALEMLKSRGEVAEGHYLRVRNDYHEKLKSIEAQIEAVKRELGNDEARPKVEKLNAEEQFRDSESPVQAEEAETIPSNRDVQRSPSEYPTASLEKRWLAMLMDSLVMLPAYFLVLGTWAASYQGGFVRVFDVSLSLFFLLVGLLPADFFAKWRAADFSFLASHVFIMIFLIVVSTSYFLIRDGLRDGQSWGKRATKLMVVRLKTHQPCNKSHSILRQIPFLCGVIVPPMGLFIGAFEVIMVLISNKRRRIGDFLAGTQVIALKDYNQESDLRVQHRMAITSEETAQKVEKG